MIKKFISDRKNILCATAFLLAVTISVTIIQFRAQSELGNKTVISMTMGGQTIKNLETENTLQNSTENLKDLLTLISELEGASKDEEIKILTYTVKSGDTLESIASTYNLKISTITESNKITADATLKEGQVLEFPSIDGVLHKIRSGETIWDIAVANKVDVERIVEVNKLEAPDKLQLDQKLIIPDIDKLKLVVRNTSTSSKPATTSTKTLSRGGGGGGGASSTSFSMPARGKITSTFGMRWGRMHTGIDIAAPTGTPIYASAGGQVTFSGWNGGYGNLVIIDHGNGMQTYYAHNSKNLVKQGQSVSKGAHIANMGNTGNSTGPHLHFEIRRNGTPLNPLNFLR
jgi:murein DD-endopeptidase MepM/ murein hydrolase activator NlpD